VSPLSESRTVVNLSQSRRLVRSGSSAHRPSGCISFWNPNWCFDRSAWKWIYTNPRYKTDCDPSAMEKQWELKACQRFEMDVWWAYKRSLGGWHFHEYPKLDGCATEFQWTILLGQRMLRELISDPAVDLMGLDLDSDEVQGWISDSVHEGDELHKSKCRRNSEEQRRHEAGEAVKEYFNDVIGFANKVGGTSGNAAQIGFNIGEDLRKKNETFSDCDISHDEEPCECLNTAWQSFWRRVWR